MVVSPQKSIASFKPLVIDLSRDDDEPIIALTKSAMKRPATTTATTSSATKLLKENIPPHSNAAVSAAASSYDSDAFSNYDSNASSNYDSDASSIYDSDASGSEDKQKPAAKPAAKTPSAPGSHFSSSERSWSLSTFRPSHDGSRDALLSACDAWLNKVAAYFSSTPELRVALNRLPEVTAYAKCCLRAISPSELKVILQLKCPVPKRNHEDETISLALGGNCPDDMRRGVVTVRCADEFFGIEKLSIFFIFNCRVECRIDCKTGRGAIISWIEGKALFSVYEVLCVFALLDDAVRRTYRRTTELQLATLASLRRI
jgi:hypothetical protein